MYKGERWTGPKLSETNGHPLTHDILATLGLLEMKHDGSGELEQFEDDVDKIQSRLIAEGASYVRRRGSISSESDHSQHGHSKLSSLGTPPVTKPPLFDKNFTFSASPSPITQSPIPRQRKSYPPAHESPLHRAQSIVNDPQLYQTEWSVPAAFNEPSKLMRSNFALKTPHLDQTLDQMSDFFSSGQWDDSTGPYDTNMGLGIYSQPFPNGLNQFGTMPDYTTLSAMELDSEFKQFIQVA